MKISDGFPIIQPTDHPITVYKALHASPGLLQGAGNEEADGRWLKVVQDAEGALQDGFGIVTPDNEPLMPDGEATIYVDPSDLELGLTAYGASLIEANDPHQAEEIKRVDQLLRTLGDLTIR